MDILKPYNDEVLKSEKFFADLRSNCRTCTKYHIDNLSPEEKEKEKAKRRAERLAERTN